MPTASSRDILTQLGACFDRGPVVVWHDAAGEFAELAADPVIAAQLGATVLIEGAGAGASAGVGALALKERVNALVPGERLLVYRACPQPGARGDWLADAECYAVRFSADATSLLLAELGARDTPAMREAAARYAGFLRRAPMCRRVRGLAGEDGFEHARELDLAVMLAALGRTARLDPADVAAAFLDACAADAEAAWGNLAAAGAAGRFEAMARALAGVELEGTGAADTPGAAVFSQVAARVLRRALAWQLDGGMAGSRDEFCFRVLRSWRMLATHGALAEACEEAFGPKPGITFEQALLQDVSLQAEELIVDGLLRRVAGLSCDVGAILRVVDDRKPSYWHGDLANYYEVVACMARMRGFQAAHADGFSGSARELWDAYQRDYCEMDRLYRHLRAAASPCMTYSVGDLDEPLRDALNAAEGIYKGWYLQQLGDAWDAAASDAYRDHGFVPSIDQARDFYALRVQGLRGRSACATVIISDALRYEVAVELAEALRHEAKGSVELRAQAAPFPSVTPLGMAALLPHGELRMSDDCREVLVDGAPSAGLPRRQEILRSKARKGVPGAVALSSGDFLQMSAAERRAMGRKAGLVYLYHNAVDEVGESDEDRLPAACRDAVAELVGLVRACARSFGPNVVVTADHGFIYTATPLGSLDRVGKDEVAGEVVSVTHRRAVLARAGAASRALLPVRMDPAGRADLAGFTPHGYLRVRQPGAGERFVHGGISLQEICVPVLRFHAQTKRSRGYEETEPATVSLLSTGRTVGDFQPIVAFHQDVAATGKVLPALYLARFETEEGEPLSSEVEVHADRASVDGEAGTIRARFSMLGIRAADGVAPEARLVLRDATSDEVLLSERFTLALPARAARPQAW